MESAKRRRIIAGNWKMYKTIEESIAFIKGLAPKIEKSPSEVLLAVPFTSLKAASAAAQGTKIQIGAQNIHDAVEGAYTGEISGKMIVDAGAKFVILGHSERRGLFHESSSWINKKVKSALAVGLTPILCIGETLQEMEAGQGEAVLKKQLTESLEGITIEELSHLMIAYEPVWAIGTGKTATPETAQKMHHYCRALVSQGWGKAQAEKIPLLYGGSVKPENVKELVDQQDIDGVLVGGASLSLDSFLKIVDYSR